jgi:polysaccharide biosynthesis transport protein
MNLLRPQGSSPVQNVDIFGAAGASPETLQSAYQTALDFIRRQYRVIAFVAATMIAMGLIYLFTTPPSYTATATMIMDTKRIQLFQQQVVGDLPVDTAAVESQVEIIKSETIALAVIKKLFLAEDPEFTGPGGGLLGTLLSNVMGLVASIGPNTSSDANSDDQFKSDVTPGHKAVTAFQSRLDVQRVGLTYIIAISFRSHNADRAARIANAVAEAYIDDQLESKYLAARRAGTWLQERLRELRQQASTAERAVVDFKNRNSMIDAGGRTINEQQLAELNSQLVLVRAQTGEARARFDRVQAVLKNNSPDATVAATVTDTLKNDVITRLRSQYLELARREADWTPRYGTNHLAVINVRNQMREIQNSVRDELQRIAETYKSDFEIAKQREESVQAQLDQAVSQSQVTNQAQVALRELESNAQSYQALYDNFLQRYMESVQQQSFPITEARVISAASRPSGKSNPNTLRVLGFAAALGLALGGIAGAWREFSDRVFRTSNQVETLLQADCIALVPLVKAAQNGTIADGRRKIKLADWPRKIKGAGQGRELRDIKGADQEREIKPADQGREIQIVKDPKSPGSSLQTITTDPEVYSAILESPFSAFAEAIRSIKVAIDLSPAVTGGRIIGFTSSVPNEGKSTIATAVARLVAHAGARTLLVDCDLKNPWLSRVLSPKASCGLLEVIIGQATLERAIWLDEATKMSFLPATMRARMANSSEILASPQVRKLLDSLRHSYDYIILDFAPLTPIVDVRASTDLVDAFVYVVAWGQTRIDHVEQALRSVRAVYDHLLGVVLNKVDLRSIGRYDGRGGGYYTHENYHRYGYTE